MEAVIQRLGQPLRLLQLDGGNLGGGVMAIRIGPLRLLQLRMDRRIHSWGPKPPGDLTISLDLEPAGDRPPIRSHGSCLPESCLFGMDSRREVHLTLPKEVVLGLVVIPIDTLCNWADQLGCGGFDLQGACRRNLLLVDPLRCEGLRAYLRQIFALVASDPCRLQQPSNQRLILEDLLPLLLEALIHGTDQVGRLPRPPARSEIVYVEAPIRAFAIASPERSPARPRGPAAPFDPRTPAASPRHVCIRSDVKCSRPGGTPSHRTLTPRAGSRCGCDPTSGSRRA
jgi:AraC family ethanolamine operon transcriptional activator